MPSAPLVAQRGCPSCSGSGIDRRQSFVEGVVSWVRCTCVEAFDALALVRAAVGRAFPEGTNHSVYRVAWLDDDLDVRLHSVPEITSDDFTTDIHHNSLIGFIRHTRIVEGIVPRWAQGARTHSVMQRSAPGPSVADLPEPPEPLRMAAIIDEIVEQYTPTDRPPADTTAATHYISTHNELNRLRHEWHTATRWPQPEDWRW